MAKPADLGPDALRTHSTSIFSHKEPARVGSPMAPLAPLEYLQNQRRGSITDPSLHAAPAMKLSPNHSLKQVEERRAPSPYTFGDATPSSGESHPQLRRILRSPSLDYGRISNGDSGGPSNDVEYNMRRHSLAGMKRKSTDSGPVPNMDIDGPAPKRRGSTVEIPGMTALSLNDDRRNSVSTFSWPSSTMQQIDPQLAMNNVHHMMPPIDIPPDRRMSLSDADHYRLLRSRSRPPSRQMDHQLTPPSVPDESAPSPTSSTTKGSKEQGLAPYSRSPELRVSHKLAERKRRKEMKELFDELRDQLPQDRGMKASKWEILSKAIDFVNQLKQNHSEMAREIEVLRHELDLVRQGGIPPFPGGHPPPHVIYGQGYPLPPPPTNMPPQPPISRPGSSQNGFSSQPGPPPPPVPSQNGLGRPGGSPPT